MAAGLTHDTHIEAYRIVKDKVNFREYMLSEKMMGKVEGLRGEHDDEMDLFQRFAKSICPEIFGMEEVK
jgi:DNA replicative helicase MCM subunit Mcm2 (Cdc46/Mcm family)